MNLGNITIVCKLCGCKSLEPVKVCPKCQGRMEFEASSIDDLRIFPKVSSMAERLSSEDAKKKAKDIFRNISYGDAFEIMNEAEELLRVLLLGDPRESPLGKDGKLEIIANLGLRIGDIAQALKTISQLPS